MSPAIAFTKRLIDIVVSSITLLVMSPLLVAISVAIKVESRGPIFYAQPRVKRYGNPDYKVRCIPLRQDRPTRAERDVFNILKFRTMVQDAESKSGAVNAEANDPRVTLVGKFLRPTRLDEIPNLINVLMGDMSIVGPRADRMEIFEDIDEHFPFIHERTRFIKPGITGLAQIKLRSNGDLNGNVSLPKYLPEIENDKEVLSFRYKLYYDFAYAMKLTHFWSFLITDLSIMIKTPIVMFFRRNVI